MKNQIKGIALILLGILVAIVSIAINFNVIIFVGALLGIVGTIVVFLNGDSNGDEKNNDKR